MEEEKVIQETEQPKKKGNGCLIAFLIFIALIAIVVTGIFLTYRKITSSLETPKDLGITYSMEDLDESFTEMGFTGNKCLDCATPIYSKPHEVEFTMSDAQASSWVNLGNHDLPQGASIENIQIKFGEDKAEISAMVTYMDKDYPVYISGNAKKATEQTITGHLDSLQVAGVSLPSYVAPMVENIVLELANGKLANMGDTLRIDTLELTEDGLKFEGLAPSVME